MISFYVLDSDKAQIQVYEPTEFTRYLHEALYLFSKGRYEESKEPLGKVLEMNNLFTYANMAMGKALYKEGDYEGALKYARLSKDMENYSDSFWEIRNVWLKHNLTAVVLILIGIFAVLKVLKLLDKKKGIFNAPRKALGKALYKEGDYEGALKYARLSKDMENYSDSFWEIRNVWLKHNLTAVVLILIGIFAVLKVLKLLDKKKGIFNAPRKALKKLGDKKLIRELKYVFTFMRHPIDGCYGIRFENKVSIASTNILLGIMMVFYIINKYFCGFLTKTVREGSYDILSDIGMILVALVLVVSCNYLMCTINEGEGKFRHIYSSLVYSFGPYAVLTPIIFLLSHVVTNNEIFFVQFGSLCMTVWIIVLIFISIREINNYTVKETFKIIFLTIFTILIVCLLIFIIYVLWSQVFDFIQSIAGEVVYRIGS